VTSTIHSKDFRVGEKKKVKLAEWPTSVKSFYKSKEDYQKILDDDRRQLDSLQNLLYAYDRYAALFIFQAMDAAGKDSAIKHVMSGVNPQGCQVFSFKQPSSEELDHDFLWRTNRCLPERGRIGIFNRSYYEEVLIVRVHPEILRTQKLPSEVLHEEKIWRSRYKSIVDAEDHLQRNGTTIAKFFLHVSKEEQASRFLKRIEEPEKNWKFSETDLHERALWDDYMHAYEECISATSTRSSPWYVIPADDKKNARLIIMKVIVDTLAALPMSYPEPDKKRLEELQAIRKLLAREAKQKGH
jgi:PPK2 family polyphosphate:nucleotide phosphotransferase